jgi:hypothetical protein
MLLLARSRPLLLAGAPEPCCDAGPPAVRSHDAQSSRGGVFSSAPRAVRVSERGAKTHVHPVLSLSFLCREELGSIIFRMLTYEPMGPPISNPSPVCPTPAPSILPPHQPLTPMGHCRCRSHLGRLLTSHQAMALLGSAHPMGSSACWAGPLSTPHPPHIMQALSPLSGCPRLHH